MKIKPLGDRVVVIADAAETHTASGLFVATKFNETTETGTVVGAGPEAVEFTEGDKILFVKGTGQDIKINDTTYITLASEAVIGILKDDSISLIRDNIVCAEADFGDQTTNAGIIIKSNIKESQGITSRWMQVHKVGPDVDFVSVGE